MSALNRTCLRLAAVAALRNQTMAAERVLDSGIGAIEALEPEKRKAVISVYTEEDGGDALSDQNGGQVLEIVELVFDMSMVEAIVDPDADQIVIGLPQTDAELEAGLDLLEAQIHRTLFEDVTLPLSKAFRDALLRVKKRASLRFREEKGEERLAHRYLIYHAQVQDDLLLPAYDPTLTGLDLLPKTIRHVASQCPDGLNEKVIVLAIAEELAPPQPPPLLGVDLTVAMTGMADGPGNAIAAPKAGNTGDGPIMLAALPTIDLARAGLYKVVLATATTFTVSDPDGDFIGMGRTGVPFADQIAFTILAGSVAFAAGDEFDITVQSVPDTLTMHVGLPS